MLTHWPARAPRERETLLEHKSNPFWVNPDLSYSLQLRLSTTPPLPERSNRTALLRADRIVPSCHRSPPSAVRAHRAIHVRSCALAMRSRALLCETRQPAGTCLSVSAQRLTAGSEAPLYRSSGHDHQPFNQCINQCQPMSTDLQPDSKGCFNASTNVFQHTSFRAARKSGANAPPVHSTAQRSPRANAAPAVSSASNHTERRPTPVRACAPLIADALRGMFTAASADAGSVL